MVIWRAAKAKTKGAKGGISCDTNSVTFTSSS